MEIVNLDAIKRVFHQDAVLEAVRQACIGHAHRRYITPMPAQLMFEGPTGDCHIKYGYATDGAIYVIKIASGFYHNATRGLPVNNGMVLAFCRKTGQPLAILQDQGWLTSWRTAAAGTLAASLAMSRRPQVLGLIGAGHQAELQARWIASAMGIDELRIWNRNLERAQLLAHKLTESGLRTSVSPSTAALLLEARLVVTTTPSTAPLFPSDEVQPGTHIVALGADSPGKQELDPQLFGRAQIIITDDHAQCLDHGDLSHAVRAGIIPDHIDQSLGALLENPAAFEIGQDAITIVDLTGLPAQDIETATAFCRLLGVLKPAAAD